MSARLFEANGAKIACLSAQNFGLSVQAALQSATFQQSGSNQALRHGGNLRRTTQ
jgi:hypothetical protein